MLNVTLSGPNTSPQAHMDYPSPLGPFVHGRPMAQLIYHVSPINGWGDIFVQILIL